ncbi:hypothetical protein GGR53DRAFT_526709 [Hypoxylon sp. FL1150]|nr:hypothetical protein GGR53DRAFT_526709 [Hypoxylon sp. FL1150]
MVEVVFEALCRHDRQWRHHVRLFASDLGIIPDDHIIILELIWGTIFSGKDEPTTRGQNKVTWKSQDPENKGRPNFRVPLDISSIKHMNLPCQSSPTDLNELGSKSFEIHSQAHPAGTSIKLHVLNYLRRELATVPKAKSTATVATVICSSAMFTGEYKKLPGWEPEHPVYEYWVGKKGVEKLDLLPPISPFPTSSTRNALRVARPETKIPLIDGSDVGFAVAAALSHPERYSGRTIDLADPSDRGGSENSGGGGCDD